MPRSRRKAFQKSLKKNRLPALLIIAGSLLILFPILYKQASESIYSPNRQLTNNLTTNISTTSAGPFKVDAQLLSKKESTQAPDRIIIPKYKIDLKVVEAKVVNGFWELSETTASHGVGSANPGENGNIVIFAHARDELFGPIRDISC
jgi:sortase (surface protein transpeptidase)